MTFNIKNLSGNIYKILKNDNKEYFNHKLNIFNI